ncbi:hypothetical protein GGS23DRAFT_317163 [Durotheca rogersii]|uniref:uncharacterized protein n=1 Tax=Durotheca rogersii TaxID=419775 RepID=UPI00221FC2A0|nr:uncharacterized protein GGS23DRAFT_317163 [Durotheca rogersii]KAI5859439.1 hypothetical protein GGS23DRAFT_317163 [Durotheca rogersii]
MASASQEHTSQYDRSLSSSAHGGQGDSRGGPSKAPERLGDDASLEDHVREKAPAAALLTKKQKFKHHCKRFWWAYLIGSILFLAAFLPILFKVVIPVAVQRIIDNQEMPVLGGAFVAVSPTQLNISITSVLDSSLPANVDPVQLYMYNKETPEFSPFVNVTLPAMRVHGETNVVVTDQTVTVTNETELVTWFGEVFDQPTVTLSTRGDAEVRLGALRSTASIDKTIEVASLDKLKGFGIEHIQLIHPALENGTNIRGTLNLPNWGALTLGIGDLSLNLMSGDLRIGLITIYDVLISHGNNSRYFDGELYLDVLGRNFMTVVRNNAEALGAGSVRIDATGNATVVDGQHIGFIEAVLNRRRVTSLTPVVQLLGDLVGSLTTGSSVSIPDLLDEVLGNTTLVENALRHWPAAKLAADPAKRSLPSLQKDLLGPGMELLKLRLKAKLARL